MNTSTATITHLFHSGYAVETAEHFLIFDYFQPAPHAQATITSGVITSNYLQSKKNIIIFVSHDHADHFDPVILNWATSNPTITYILSSDVQTNTEHLHAHILSAYEKIVVGDVNIKAFGSTDQGISFLVQVDGLSIFHAGDLNWWHWSGEPLPEQAAAELAFKTEMKKLAAEVTSPDIAFFPVDRRMEEFYSLGAEYFAKKCTPKLLVPMHFGKDFAATEAFAEKAQKLAITTVVITHQGQQIFF